MGGLLFGESASKPHTSELNDGFCLIYIYIYLSYVIPYIFDAII